MADRARKSEIAPSSSDKENVAEIKVGFDLDGVLCERRVTHTPEECAEARRSKVPVPNRKHEIYIISARTEDLRDETKTWLAKNGIEHEKLLLLEENNLKDLSESEIDEKQALFKANAVNELDLDVYVEDRSNVRDYLQEYCPDCTILSPSEARNVLEG